MKKFITAVLVCLLVFQACPVYAQTATSSNWDADAYTASSSDWNFFTPFDWDAYNSEFGISPAADGLPDVTTTASYKNIRLYVAYYDMNNNTKWAVSSLNSSYYASISRPSDCASVRLVQIAIDSGSLPPPGKYSMKVKFTSNTGLEYSGFLMGSWKSVNNASDDGNSTSNQSLFDQFSGDWSCVATVDVSNVNRLWINANLKNNSPSQFPIGGYVSVSFAKSTATPDYTMAGQQTSEDIQRDISNSAGQIADNTNAINGTLKELIQHISDQLHALWDQMYNYMHLRLVANDNARTQRIIDRLDEGFDINVEVLDRNFHDLMDNDDKNTNTVVNGYDNSGMNSDNSRLDTAIGNYTDVENSVLDSVNTALGNFEFSGSMDSYLACIGTVSGFMQDLYDSSGALKDAIVIGFLLSIASIVIGLYRFKEG